MLRARSLLLLAVGLCALLAPSAHAQFPGQDVLQLSAGSSGGANGPSRNPAISQDKRFARLAAFESEATNLTGGVGSTTNVYAVEREGGFGENGTPWSRGAVRLVSVGRNGPANGPSTQPSIDGTSRVAPHCVAFVSAASNLVAGDTNGRPDAFVRDLRTGRTIRVSVAAGGRQSNGTVSEVAINGLCTRVAFVSDAGDLALTKTKNPSWRSAITKVSPAGRRQVYMHAFGGTKRLDQNIKDLTFMASSKGKLPGNADSFGVAFATNSSTLTFASDASNLVGGDGNGASDVYQVTMVRKYRPAIKGRRPQYLGVSTQLVSRDGSGNPGRGTSTSPATNVDGSVVAYVTTAPNLIGADPGGVAQVVQATLNGGGVTNRLASRTSGGGPGNGASVAPSVTAGGSWVVFQSAASNVGVDPARNPDSNQVDDIELFTQPSGDRWLLGARGATSPAANPMTTPHGNYVVYERSGQVWLNYLGAK